MILAKYSKGFTLVEVSLVIIILGILASIALPGFNRTLEAQRAREARVNLELIFAAEQVILLQTNDYQDCTDTADCNQDLSLSLRGGDWAYSVTTAAGPPPTFTAVATRQGGVNNSETITIDQTGVCCGGTWSL